MLAHIRSSRLAHLATRSLGQAAVPVLYLICYAILDAVSFVHPYTSLGITPWNPSTGLSVVLLWLGGGWAVLWAALAPLLSGIVVRGAPNSALPFVLSAVWIAIVYRASIWTLVRLNVSSSLSTARDVVWFIAVIIPATLVVALGYVSAFRSLGSLPADEFLTSVQYYWIGDLNGILVVAPALLVWSKLRSPIFDDDAPVQGRRIEVVLQVAAIALALWLIFAMPGADEFKSFYLLLLPIIWISARFGLAGGALGIVVVQSGLMAVVQAIGYQTATFVEFQLLMLALCTTGLILGAVVSERRRANELLHQQEAALHRAERFAAAGEMTAALAHEVNNPIAAMLQYLQASQILMERSTCRDPQLQEALHKALVEGRRASNVVRSLRDLYRAERLEHRAVDLRSLAARIVRRLGPDADRLAVDMDLQVSGPVMVSGDEVQLHIVLRNLVENALAAAARSGQRGRVHIRVDAVDNRPGVIVLDDGPGFVTQTEELRFASMRSDKHDGMGLGLAIAYRIVTAHGGSLRVERSSLGGAQVVVQLDAPRE